MRKFMQNDNGFRQCDNWIPYCWINVECPDEDDIRFLLDDLDMPADFIDSIADIDETSRVDVNNSWIMTILRIPIKQSDGRPPYITVPIGIITNGEIVITLCYHKSELIPDFINYSRRKGLRINSPADFAFRIIFSSAYWYLRYLKKINHTVNRASDQLEKSVRNEDLIVLQQLQKTLVYFNTSLKGNAILISKMQHVYGPDCDADLIEDVEIDLHQADMTVNIYMEILDSTLSSFASIISNNVNDIMKKMTSISIVLMVPTLVASFYGMNVEISYGNHPWVFWVIVGCSLTLSFMLYLILRRNRWF